MRTRNQHEPRPDSSLRFQFPFRVFFDFHSLFFPRLKSFIFWFTLGSLLVVTRLKLLAR